MATVIGTLLISAAINALTREDPPADSPLDDTPTPTAKHGTFMPVLFGRRRVAPLFAWVGDRRTQARSTSSGGNCLTSGGSTYVVEVFERAWHTLCVGPAAALTKIISSGTVLFDQRITPSTHPSGTVVSYPNSSFKPYWGEDDQPIDALVADKVAASRFPGIVSIVWGDLNAKGMFLGQGTTWPSMTYEMEARVEDSALKGSPAWLEESVVDADDSGVNPAHALWQLLTQTYPRGAGIDESRVDMGALERLGDLCAEEHLPMNVLLRGGAPIVDVVAAILADLSVMMPQVGEILTFVPIRQDESPVNLTEDLILPPLPETIFKHGRTRSDRIVFIYKDQRNGYKDQDLTVDDDGSADTYGVPKTRKVALRIPTHPIVAATIVDRRQQEELIDRAVVTLRATRAARTLVPGQAFTVPGAGQFRLLSTKIDDQTNEVTLEAIADYYAPAKTGYEPPEPDINIPEYDAENDLAYTFFEYPAAILQELAIGVFRHRGNSAIMRSNIWLSGNGTSYLQGYAQKQALPGGILTSEFNAAADYIAEVGPTMDANDDIDDVRNLTGDDENWRLGKQLLILEDEVAGEHEILFVRNVTALGGVSFRLDGLIRARYDTQRRTFPVGTKAYIFQWGQIEVIRDPLLIKGLNLYVKSQPGTSRQLVDISTVTPVSKTIVGRGVRPLPTGNFRANDDGSHPVDEYGTGGDVFFEWTYRVKDGAGAAAGEQRAGVPVTGVPPHDGVFKVEIIDPAGPTVVRTFEIDSDTTQQNYTNSQLVADFSGEPATFDARVTNVDGAYVSEEQEITIVKV